VCTHYISLRSDGSVDRTRIDKIFVLAKTVTDGRGEAEQVYIDVAEPKEWGAVGMVNALKLALTNTFGKEVEDVVNLASSIIVTDGTSVNIAEKAGLMGPVATGTC